MLSRPLASTAVLQTACRQLAALAPLSPALVRVSKIAGRSSAAGLRRGCATQTPPATTTKEEPHTSDGGPTTDKRSSCEKRRFAAALGALGGGLLIAGSCVRPVPAGHAGVEDLFGNVSSQLRTSGLQFKNPLAQIYSVSLKTTKADFKCSVPSQEGLMVDLHITLQYRLDPDRLVSLYKDIGLDFLDVLITPQVHSAVRSATSSRDAKALYTAEREQIRLELLESLNNTLNQRGIIVEDVPLRTIVLPGKLTEAIERKLQMEQESQRMDFVLEKERQEAQRKAIEARGIADFQNIVSKGID